MKNLIYAVAITTIGLLCGCGAHGSKVSKDELLVEIDQRGNCIWHISPDCSNINKKNLPLLSGESFNGDASNCPVCMKGVTTDFIAETTSCEEEDALTYSNETNTIRKDAISNQKQIYDSLVAGGYTGSYDTFIKWYKKMQKLYKLAKKYGYRGDENDFISGMADGYSRSTIYESFKRHKATNLSAAEFSSLYGPMDNDK